MTEKLRDYQVLDVLCGGTLYKVRHKVTNKIFTWKAYNCSAYSNKQIQNVVEDVKTISKVSSDNLLQYYDTILHAPTKTLYFVLEHNSWRSLEQLIENCHAFEKYVAESFIWRLLLELARVCKAVDGIYLVALQKCLTPANIFVEESGEVRVNCFEVFPEVAEPSDLMRQVGEVVRSLCDHHNLTTTNPDYSDDLRDVVAFLTDDRNTNLKPDVILYHPTVLANVETHSKLHNLSDILIAPEQEQFTASLNKCDSEKAGELCRVVEPMPRSIGVHESPVYCNVSPKHSFLREIEEANSPEQNPMSPTIAALALELPGYVPRSRKPYTHVQPQFSEPQQISQETLSQQWMSRMIALRQREESLNQRERDILAKEIANSPAVKVVGCNEVHEQLKVDSKSNGITLPPVINKMEEKVSWVSRRRHRRSGSVRTRSRRKSQGYEDLDSSLSADNGDGSIIVTSTKFTKENMPRRNIFPEVSTKKVHFTPVNPFVESDESVTLTFYELDNNEDASGYQVPRQDEKVLKDIKKFKYLDLEKLATEKRAAMNWSHSSPSKQAKLSKNIFSDITNTGSSIQKTPSKSSLTSKGSNSSRCSMFSLKSQWSMDSSSSKVSEGASSITTRGSMRKSLMQTPVAPPELKKAKRKSLIPFKTPFKFMSSTKI